MDGVRSGVDGRLLLVAEGLTIGYRQRRAQQVIASEIDLTLAAGELFCLLGPNGVGKSTLLRTLAGMQPPLGGRVRLLGEDVHRLPPRRRARHLGVVLTERVDVGALSVYGLVALGRHPYTDWRGRLRAEDDAVVHEVLVAVGAGDLMARNVSELSDGQRQKVMIARALAQQPAVMILDEPTAFLDLPHRVETMQILRVLAHQTGRAVLLSTHDLDLALRNADRIGLMAAGGRLEVGAPEDLVLSGAFQAVFESERVAFDVQSGAFEVSAPPGQLVAVAGEGAAAVWTRRALVRAGYAVAENGRAGEARLRVVVRGGNGSPCWVVVRDGGREVFGSLGEVVVWLRGADSLG